jgi:cytochrome c biogenesis protein CcmG/thiol:disulfide interchange protein DsbE
VTAVDHDDRVEDPPGDAGPDAMLPRRGRRSVLVAVIASAVVLGAFVLLLVGAKQPDSRSAVVGKPAPSVERGFDTLETNDRVRLADFRGRYVVLNFFASWCVPCEQEHPELVRFQQRHAAAGDATVVQVLYNDKPGPARQFFRERGGGGWPVLIDEEGQFALDYGVTGPPETFLIDPQGFVLTGVKGAIDQGRLDDLLTRAKAGRP